MMEWMKLEKGKILTMKDKIKANNNTAKQLEAVPLSGKLRR